MPVFSIRAAAPDDAAIILALLSELAAFEGLPIALTEAAIARDFFGADAAAGCELGFEGGEAVGIVTWYRTYRSFAGARGLFLEDLFVRPQWRGRGYGQALLKHMAAKADAMGVGRLEWLVLDWNAPAILFYQTLGARPVADWLTYRLEGAAMKELGKS